MSYKITRGRVPTDRSESASKPTKAAAKPRPADTNPPHATPYSVWPPMNSLMIDVGGIAAISSGESATI